MTGTVTGSIVYVPGGQVITLDWLCNASGDALADLYSELDIGYVTGEVVFIETAPGLDGDLTTNLPTAAYDLYLNDLHSYDWAGGELEDRSGTVAEKLLPTATLIFLNQRLVFKVDNAGNAKCGRAIIGIRNLFGR